MNNQSSLQQSSVHSYQDVPSPSANFIRQLHTRHPYDRNPYQEETANTHSSPMIKRGSPRMPSPREGSSFKDSLIYTSLARRDEARGSKASGAQDFKWQAQNDLLVKENRRLKEEVRYWKEEKEKVDQKNSELVKYKTKAELLQREYQRVISEIQHFKQLQHSQTPLNLAGLTNFSQSQSYRSSTAFEPVRSRGGSPEDLGVSASASRYSANKASTTPIYKVYEKAIEPIPEQPLLESHLNKRDSNALEAAYNKNVALLEESISSMKKQEDEYKKRISSLEQQVGEMKRAESQREANFTKKVNELSEKQATAQKQLRKIKDKWANMGEKNQEYELTIKMLEHELSQKREAVQVLEEQANRHFQELQTHSKRRQEENQSKEKIQSELNEEYRQLSEQYLSFKQRMEAKKTDESRQLHDLQLVLQSERQRHAKSRQANAELLGLRDEWKKMELQLKWTKQMDSTVDHLWSIKELEYANVLEVVESIRELEREST